jgi:transcriptional regulator with XRE-family HTH domain
MTQASNKPVEMLAVTQEDHGAGFGGKMKARRLALGFTLRDVEKITEGELSNAYLSQLENGKIKRPSAHVVLMLCAAYAVKHEDALQWLGLPNNIPAPRPCPTCGQAFPRDFAPDDARLSSTPTADRNAVLEEADELRRVRSAVFAILRRHDVDEQLFAEVAAATFCPPIRLPSASPTMDEIVEVPTGDLREYARFVADLPCETKGAEDLEPGCCLPCRARSLLSRLQEQG